MKRFAILVGPHGRGSNMAALAEASRDGRVEGEVCCVISPVAESAAADRARELGLEVRVVAPGDGYGDRLLEALKDAQYICLAGFMRLLPPEVLANYPNKVLNIHPALLPKFGGRGMYGMHVHRAVIAAGETESGCTVHYVNERYDEGAIILHAKCPVLPTDTPEDLAARVLKLEHKTFAEALALVMCAKE